jgi:hypothetical protein
VQRFIHFPASRSGDKASRSGDDSLGPPSDIVEFARNALGLDLDAKQQEVLRSRSRRVILNCTRQWGKSTITAVKALYTALSGPGRTVVVVSPGMRQSREFIRKVKEMIVRRGMKVKGDGDQPSSVGLPNRSRILGLPGTEATVRGFSADLVVIDEAAGVPDKLYSAVRPMVGATGGEVWILSTPRWRHGFFYETWTRGGDDWGRYSVKATECPRIPIEHLERERADMEEDEFEAEYMCRFRGDDASLFRAEDIDGAFRDELEELKI